MQYCTNGPAVIVTEQRNGPTGEFKLPFLKEYTRFEDYAAAQKADPEPEPKQRLPYSKQAWCHSGSPGYFRRSTEL